MEPNELEVIDSELDTETTENNDELELITEEESEEVDVEALKKENATLKAQKDHWRKKAEKPGASEAEKSVPKSGDLSTKDVLYLAKADIHEDDMEEVTDVATKMFNGDVKKAHEYLKPRFAVKAEERKTAEATHTGNARRSSGKVSDDALLANANSGKLPESEDEIARLIRAKTGRKN